MKMTAENHACDKGGFTIVWKIENLSLCLVTRGNGRNSSVIIIPKFSGKWKLMFYPRGKSSEMVECDLGRYDENRKEIIDCLLCVCTSKGDILYKNETENIIFTADRYSTTYKNLAKFERNLLERIPDDTLVIHCHIWNHTSDRTEAPLNCFLRTTLGIHRKVFYWKMDNFNTLQLREERAYELPSVVEDRPSLVFTLSLIGTNVMDSSVQISLNFKNVQSGTFFTCALFVVSPTGTTTKYMRDEYVLGSGNHLSMFPYFLQRRELVSEDLSDDTLTIRGEVTFSGDYGEVEYVEHGIQTRETSVADSTPNLSSALSADMLALLEGSGPPSDFELRVGRRSFPVHQLVLGTRSAVFRAMFENDMLEQSARSVELTDLDVDTTERLLKFVYADVEPPAGLACEPLSGLYSAADKYQILALKKICAKRLVQRMQATDAPRILQLADRHRDHDFKEEVIELIFKGGRAVLESDQWKDLEQNDSQLAADTLRRIFCEKVLV